MQWLVETSTNKLIQLSEGANAPDGHSALAVPNGVAPGNCKLVDGALVDMGSEKLNANPYWASLRAERNARLAACDWTQLQDSGITGQLLTDWQTYRTALRNLPENTSDPQSPTWPEEP